MKRTKGKALTDEDLMPFGGYKGWKLKDVWEIYLLRILNNGQATGRLKTYITNRKEQFENQVRKNRNEHQRKLKTAKR